MPPYRGLGPKLRHVPWPGIKIETLWYTGWCRTNWATLAQAVYMWKPFSQPIYKQEEKPEMLDFTCQYQAVEAALCFLISLPHSAQKIPLWTGFCFLIIILDCSHSIFCHNPVSVETIIKTVCLLQGIPIGSHRQRKGESTGSQVSKELSSDKDQN